MANLQIELQLDLTPFKEGLKGALRLGENFSSQFQDLLSGVTVEADLSQLDQIADEVEAEITGIEGEATITGDGSEAIDEAEDVEAAVDAIPDEKTLTINAEGDALDTLGNLSLIYTGLMQAGQQVMGMFGGLTEKANVQEDAEYSLKAALRNTGLEVDNNLSKLKNYASGLQEITRYGDEAILMGTALAQNIGKFAAEDLPRVQKAAIGLASTYKIDLQTAFQMIGRAAAGQTQMLTRYGIVIDMTKSKEEQFQQVLEKGIDGFAIAEEMAENTSGEMEQLGNVFGDLQEKIGDLMKLGLTPLLPIFEGAISLAGGFFDALTKTPLERTIDELERLGANVETINKLKKLQLELDLMELQHHQKKKGYLVDEQTLTGKIEESQQNLISFNTELAEIYAKYGKENLKNLEDMSYGKIVMKGLGGAASDVVAINEALNEAHQKELILLSKINTERKNISGLGDQLGLMSEIELKKQQLIALTEKQGAAEEEIANLPSVPDVPIGMEFEPFSEEELELVAQEVNQAIEELDLDKIDVIDPEKIKSDLDLALDDVRKWGSAVSGTVNNISGAWSAYYDLQSTNIENEYNDRKKAIEDSAKSEEDKKKKLEKLDEEYAEKKKELAEAQKPVQIGQAISNTALGVIRAFADPGGIPGLILSMLVAAQGAFQIATIKAQKYNEGEVDIFSEPIGDILGVLQRYGSDGIIEIKGPGTDMSDSILALLSRGETITDAEGTRKNKGPLSYIKKGGVIQGYADGEIGIEERGAMSVERGGYSTKLLIEQNRLLRDNLKFLSHLKNIDDNTNSMRKARRRF